MSAPSQGPPFFIVGAGRSGTTLVRTLLAAHSRLAVTPETHYLKWTDQFGADRDEAPEDFDEFWRQLILRRQFLDTGVHPDRVLALTEHTGGRTFRGVFAAMLAAYAEDAGKPRAGEKTPGHYLYLDRIFKWFPDAKVIAIRRDPRAVIASHLKSPWVTQQLEDRSRRAPVVPRLRLFHVAQRAHLWNAAYGDHIARAEGDPRCHIVSYEELVSRPEAVTAEMTEFLGEAFEPDMVGDRGAVPGSAAKDKRNSERWRNWVYEHEAQAKAPISAEGLDKWRQTLTDVEVNVIEGICGPIMARYSYEMMRPQSARATGSWLGRAALLGRGFERRLRRSVGRLRAG